MSLLKNVYPSVDESYWYSLSKNKNLYNNLDSLSINGQIFSPQPLDSNTELPILNKLTTDEIIVNAPSKLPLTSPYISFKQEKPIQIDGSFAEFKSDPISTMRITPQIKSDKDNLHFYNIPSPSIYREQQQQQQQYNTSPNKNTIEQMTSNMQSDDCNLYTKHVLDCNKCKGMILKQFNIENDRIRNEEILELISYIMFGILILLIIDYIKRSN